MTATDAAVYRKAADVLRTEGWCQGTLEDDEGRHCLAGALRAALRVDLQRATYKPQMLLLAELLGWGSDKWGSDSLAFSIMGWNDDPKRTLDEVTALLEQAAEKVEADQ